MNIRPIRSQSDYERGLLDIKRLWHARPGSVEESELEAIGALVEEYEKRVYPLPHADPIDAIKFRMEQGGLTSTDMLPIFGTRGRLSEVLNGKRPLTLDMIRQLHFRLGIPLESLVTETSQRLERRAG
jgi:HTH-type transcriptional regulator/antitoxin HigA